MSKKTHGLMYGMAFIFSGCNLQELQNAIAEASNASTITPAATSTGTPSAGSCNYTVSAVYLVKMNPDTDFVVHHPAVNEAVIESNCDGVTEGETQSVYADSIARHANQIQISDDLNLELLSANGSVLTEANHSDCEGSYRVTHEFLAGSVDVFNETLKVQMKISYDDDGSCVTPSPSPTPGESNPSTRQPPLLRG